MTHWSKLIESAIFWNLAGETIHPISSLFTAKPPQILDTLHRHWMSNQQNFNNVFAHILLARTQPLIDQSCPQQSGLLLADQPLMPSSLCISCQSYIANLTDHWTLHSWTLSLLSTPSITLPSGKHFTAKACLTSYSIRSLPFMRTLVHVSGLGRNCRREFPPPLVSDMVAS